MGNLRIDFPMIIGTLIGLALSVYAFTVEVRMEEDIRYNPMCDLSEHMSCSKAFMSKYGKGFGIISPNSIFHQPNSLYGIMFYNITFFLILLVSPAASRLLVLLYLLANLSTVYFAFILMFILYDFCVVCVSLYVVNAVLLVMACNRHRIVMSDQKPKIQ